MTLTQRGRATAQHEWGDLSSLREHTPPTVPAHPGGLAAAVPHTEVRSHGRRLELALILLTDLTAVLTLCFFARSLTLMAVTATVAVATWRARGLYSHRIALSTLDDLPELSVGVLVGLAPGVAAALMVPTGLVGATATLQVALSVLGVVAAGRVVSYSVILHLRRRGTVVYPTVLVGSGPTATSLVRRIETHPESGLRVVGTIAYSSEVTADVPLLGRPTELSHIVTAHNVSNVVIGDGGHSPADLVEVLRTADWADLEIHVVPRLAELATTRATDDHIWGLPLVRLRAPANRRVARRTKRYFDIAGALCALLLMAPVMLAVALSVRLSLGPGIFFTQTRVGLNGRPFELVKFRSMGATPRVGSDAWTVPSHELGRVGRFIRRYSLDELPQLLNVLAGDMSLIGPRPERPEYVERFERHFPYYAHRHRMMAGMTGLAAVNGLRGDTSIEERCEFDNWYIDNWSLWLDVKIALRTMTAVVRGTGR